MSATVAVREHGLPMSGPLIAPTMDGRKRQTRRLHGLQRINEAPDEWAFDRWQDGYRDGRRRAVFIGSDGEPVGIVCPYGQPGDRLWVRETFNHFFLGDSPASCLYLADAGTHRWRQASSAEDAKRTWPGWKPSIHMPRWASRITLELTDVRVERVQDISEDDAIAEGVFDEKAHDGLLPSQVFRETCALLNAKRGYGWERNPWVWVLAFRRMKS